MTGEAGVLEVAGGIALAVLILVYFGEMHALMAGLFGGLLLLLAAALAYFLRIPPLEIAIGIVVGAVVLGAVLREANADRDERRP